MPGHYKQSLYFPAATKDYITTFEQNPYKHCVAYTATHPQINTSKMSQNRKRLLRIYHVEYYLDHDPEYPSVGAEY